jgi:membrane protein required for colicin V production
MHWLDMLLLGLLGFGAALGFWSGLIMQLARLVCLGVSIYVTFLLNEPVTRLLHGRIAPDTNVNLLHGLAYIGVFLAVYIALFALSRLLYRVVSASRLVFLDRLAGAVLGACKTALILAPVCAVLVFLSLPPTDEWLNRSTIAPLLARGAREAVAMLPDSYRTQAHDSVEHVRDRLQRAAVDRIMDLDQIEAALKK